jgi:multicomponent Na+:H+ antiporter subunit G
VTPLEAAVSLCAFGTVFFFGLATLGLFRLPDVYSRAHATSKADTMGTLFAVGGALLGGGDAPKLLFLLLFVLATTPTATHAIVHAADVEGYEAWTAPEGAGETAGREDA